jgi:hypothetical protein
MRIAILYVPLVFSGHGVLDLEVAKAPKYHANVVGEIVAKVLVAYQEICWFTICKLEELYASIPSR